MIKKLLQLTTMHNDSHIHTYHYFPCMINYACTRLLTFLDWKKMIEEKKKSSRIREQTKDPLLELLTRFSTGGTHLLYTFAIHSLNRYLWGRRECFRYSFFSICYSNHMFLKFERAIVRGYFQYEIIYWYSISHFNDITSN